jgi:hypothetical protein
MTTTLTVYEYDDSDDLFTELCVLHKDGSVDGSGNFADDVRTFVTELNARGHTVSNHWDYVRLTFLEKYNNGYLFCRED